MSSKGVAVTPTMLPSPASASGKVILLGEHAVVYGRRALAAAIDIGLEVEVAAASADLEPMRPRLAEALVRAGEVLGVDVDGLTATIRSQLPRAVGLGSSAALSVALIRAVARAASLKLTLDDIRAASFEIEKIFHGTPSGLDNTVASMGGLVSFVRDGEIVPVRVGQPFTLVIAIGRVPRQTKLVIGALRERWDRDRARHELLFDSIERLVVLAQSAIEAGDLDSLGKRMTENQKVLDELGISTGELDKMIGIAMRAGALGAKLTGGGGGGAIIALAANGGEDRLVAQFERAEFTTLVTRVF